MAKLLDYSAHSKWVGKHQIGVVVEGGAVQNIFNIPKGMTVKVIDYDVDGMDDTILDDIPQADCSIYKACVTIWPADTEPDTCSYDIDGDELNG